jgi:AbrB family looped-hinge helix DNA binding protein
MIWTVPISSKGQVTLPASLRQDLGVIPGRDKVMFQKENGEVMIKTAKKALYDLAGVLAGHPKSGLKWEKISRFSRLARARHIAGNG